MAGTYRLGVRGKKREAGSRQVVEIRMKYLSLSSIIRQAGGLA